MPLVPAICTQCGAQIEVDNTHEAGVCKHCGTAFITEKAINNYNTYVTKNTNINANVVNIYNNQKDFVIKAGKLIEYNGTSDTVVVPSEVQIIAKGAFSKADWDDFEMAGSNIKKILLPSSVTQIEEFAFHNCQNLTVVIMSNNISLMGNGCFSGCKRLNTIEIKDNVDALVSDAFLDIREGTVQLPAKLKKIAGLMFNGCDSIKQVIIPDGITEIEEFAFTKLANLQEVTIPDSVINCHFEAFKAGLYTNDNIRIVHASEEWKRKNYGKISCLASYAPMDSKQKSGCYIATCVYGSYNCPEVWTLRRFRDEFLDITWYGRLFVRFYYAISPTIVRVFGRREWFREFWKKKLDVMVDKLNSKGIESSRYEDKKRR